MGKILTAKDKAFQAERMRLMKEAEKFRQLVIERDGQLAAKDKEIKEKNLKIESLEKRLEDYHEHFNISEKELNDHIEHEQALYEMLNNFWKFCSK